MKARWKILIAVTVFLAVFTGIWLVTMRLQPESEVEAYKKSLRAKGEKLEISEVCRRRCLKDRARRRHSRHSP